MQLAVAVPAPAAGVSGNGGVAAAPLPLVPSQPQPQRAEAGLVSGQLVANKWRLIQRIGRGAFGDIFVSESEDAAHNRAHFAMKLEKLPPIPAEVSQATGEEAEAERQKQQAAAAARAVLKLEAVILSKLQKYPFVGRFIEYGRDLDLGVAYLTMSLLGENLLRLRRRRPNGKFSLSTILRFGIQAIRCIQAVHEVGFLHRDIKPSNFVIGSNRNTIHGNMHPNPTPSSLTAAQEAFFSPSKIFIIDFGLARAYRDRATGQVLPSRGHIKGFRGTPRYASVHVHREEDLGRRDDLWSLFYILVEFATGDLPWGNKKDKDEIGKIKETYMSLKLLKTGAPGDCPSCFIPFMKHLYSLKFESKPNYAYLIELLQHKLKKMGYGSCEGDGAPDAVGEDVPFDWEDCSTISTMDNSSSTTSLLPPTRSPFPLEVPQAMQSNIMYIHPQQQQAQVQPPETTPVHKKSHLMDGSDQLPKDRAPKEFPDQTSPQRLTATLDSGNVLPQPIPSSNSVPTINTTPVPIPTSIPLTAASPLPVSTPAISGSPSSSTSKLVSYSQQQGSPSASAFSNLADVHSQQQQQYYQPSNSLPLASPRTDTEVRAPVPTATASAPAASPTSSTLMLPLSQPLAMSDIALVSPRKQSKSQTSSMDGSSKANPQTPLVVSQPTTMSQTVPPIPASAPAAISTTKEGLVVVTSPDSGNSDASPALLSSAKQSTMTSNKPPRHGSSASMSGIKFAEVSLTSSTTAATAKRVPAAVDVAAGHSKGLHTSTPNSLASPVSISSTVLDTEDQRADLLKQRSLGPVDETSQDGSARFRTGGGVGGETSRLPLLPQNSPVASIEEPDWAALNSSRVHGGGVGENENHPATSPSAAAASSAASAAAAAELATQAHSTTGAFTARFAVDREEGGTGDAAGRERDDDENDEEREVAGDGRTLAPVTLAEGVEQNPAHSLNDAYVMSMPHPDGSIAAEGEAVNWTVELGSVGPGIGGANSAADKNNTSFQLFRSGTGTGLGGSPYPSRMNVSFVPSDSPTATPQRAKRSISFAQPDEIEPISALPPAATASSLVSSLTSTPVTKRDQPATAQEEQRARQVVGSLLLAGSDDDDTSSSAADSESERSPAHSKPTAKAISAAPATTTSSVSAPAVISHDTNQSSEFNLDMKPVDPSTLPWHQEVAITLSDLPPLPSMPPLPPLPSTSRSNSDGLPMQGMQPADAASSSSSADQQFLGVLNTTDSTPPHTPRAFRPTPPSGQPAPTYAKRSFGRFKGRLERSPAKPLSKEQLAALDISTEQKQE